MNGLWGFYEDDKMTVDSNYTEMEYSLRCRMYCIPLYRFHSLIDLLIQTILYVPVVLSFRIQNNKNGTSPFYKLLLCYHTRCTSFHSPQWSLKI